MLPLSQIFGFCRDIDKVFRDVKHSSFIHSVFLFSIIIKQFNTKIINILELILDREISDNYIMRANGVAAGKYNISHISLWMPKVKPSLRVESEIDSMLVKGHIKELYFEQMRVY